MTILEKDMLHPNVINKFPLLHWKPPPHQPCHPNPFGKLPVPSPTFSTLSRPHGCHQPICFSHCIFVDAGLMCPAWLTERRTCVLHLTDKRGWDALDFTLGEWSSLCRVTINVEKKLKFIETESKMTVTRSWRETVMGNYCLICT